MPTYESGRVCVFVGPYDATKCTTILSVSNKAAMCYLHQPAKIPRLRGIMASNKNHRPIEQGSMDRPKEDSNAES